MFWAYFVYLLVVIMFGYLVLVWCIENLTGMILWKENILYGMVYQNPTGRQFELFWLTFRIRCIIWTVLDCLYINLFPLHLQSSPSLNVWSQFTWDTCVNCYLLLFQMQILRRSDELFCFSNGRYFAFIWVRFYCCFNISLTEIIPCSFVKFPLICSWVMMVESG